MMTDKPVLYFAESCPYGLDTLSDANEVICFPTPEDRQHWVDDDGGPSGTHFTRQKLSRKEAAAKRVHLSLQGGSLYLGSYTKAEGYIPPEHTRMRGLTGFTIGDDQ